MSKVQAEKHDTGGKIRKSEAQAKLPLDVEMIRG